MIGQLLGGAEADKCIYKLKASLWRSGRGINESFKASELCTVVEMGRHILRATYGGATYLETLGGWEPVQASCGCRRTLLISIFIVKTVEDIFSGCSRCKG